jgi:hypothetical protein
MQARVQRFVGYSQPFALEKLFDWDVIATGWLNQHTPDKN